MEISQSFDIREADMRYFFKSDIEYKKILAFLKTHHRTNTTMKGGKSKIVKTCQRNGEHIQL